MSEEKNQEKSALHLFLEANPSMVPDIPGGHGDGWNDVVLEALKKLQALSAETGVGIKIRQIKEKFGGLRLYIQVDEEDSLEELQVLEQTPEHVRMSPGASVGSVRERAYAIVRAAEDAAAERCETCGASPGPLRNLGGYRCRMCDACLAKRGGEARDLRDPR